MGFCNSCGRPIVKADYGTNADGSLNEEYCKDCFQNGEFTEPDITLEEMITRKTKEMMEKHHVTQMTSTKLKEVHEDYFIVEKD